MGRQIQTLDLSNSSSGSDGRWCLTKPQERDLHINQTLTERPERLSQTFTREAQERQEYPLEAIERAEQSEPIDASISKDPIKSSRHIDTQATIVARRRLKQGGKGDRFHTRYREN